MQQETSIEKRSGAPLMEDVKAEIHVLRDVPVLLDADVAAVYGVETRVVNQAVRRNADRFPSDYRFQLSAEEYANLKSQNVTSSWGGSRSCPYAFTEKGLYMLATVLKSPRATAATFAIIETFAQVRALRRELVALHKEKSTQAKQESVNRFGKLLSEVVMPELETVESESTLEINFLVGKIKHTVRRIKRKEPKEDGK